MKWTRLFLFACVVALGMSPAIAQEAPRFLFEVTIDGAIVAKPELRVASGRQGLIVLTDEYGELRRFEGLQERIAFTPTDRGDEIALAFDITSMGRQFRPSLVIDRSVRGAIEWTTTSEGRPLRLTVSWLQ
jgi:hypothetical protein